MKRHETVGAALRRDCFGAFWWDRGIKPLLRFDHDHDHDLFLSTLHSPLSTENGRSRRLMWNPVGVRFRVIRNPACATRRWALEFNAVGVKARELELADRGRNVGEACLAPTNWWIGKPALWMKWGTGMSPLLYFNPWPSVKSVVGSFQPLAFNLKPLESFVPWRRRRLLC